MATRLLKISSALRTYSNKTSFVKVKSITFYDVQLLYHNNNVNFITKLNSLSWLGEQRFVTLVCALRNKNKVIISGLVMYKTNTIIN